MVNDLTTPGHFRNERNLTRPARAFRAVMLLREIARAICFIAAPVSVWVLLQPIVSDLTGSTKLLLWITGSIGLYLISYFGITYASLSMRPLLAAFFLLLVIGPSARVVIPYVWQTREALSYAIVFGSMAALALPFLRAWWWTWRLTTAERLLARPCPPLHSIAELYREMFSVWPGLKRSKLRAVIADVLTYAASMSLLFGSTVLAVFGFLFIALMPLFLQTHGIGEVLMQLLALLIILCFTGLIQSFLRRTARWFSRASYAEQVERDQRPPILFLRSFQDDQVHLPERGWWRRWVRALLAPGIRGRRLDHFLVESFSRYGPALALGNPGEKQLPFGAARVYCTHDTWKDQVAEIANRANYVVLVADSTPGVEWEIWHFLTPAWREKTLFIVAPKSKDLREAPTLATAIAAEGVPEGGPPILACYWDHEGRLQVLRADVPRSPEAFIVAMQTFFRERLPYVDAP
jgi:hypothetical protein